MSLTLTLKDNGGNPVSGEGTSITLNNTTETNFTKFDLYGDTEQQTYIGKNLYQTIGVSTASGGLTSTLQPDGTLKITGTADSNSSNFTGTMATSLPAGTYTFSMTKTMPFRILLRASNNQNIGVINAGGTNVTFTTTETLTSLWVWGYLLTSGTTYNETVGFMLESGSSATSFEPYVGGTASPNPDYPQEVKTVTGEQTITVSNGQGESQVYPINLGKNLCDGVSQGYWLTTTTTAGGVSSGDSGLIIAVAQNTSYTISTTGAQSRYRIAFSDSTYQGSQLTCYDGANRDGTADSITRNSSTHKYLIVNATDLTKIQIEKGSTATTYAPYFTPIELCKIGDYQDYIYKSGDDWYIHKDIEKFTMNGSENWSGNWNNPSTPSYWTAYLTKANFTDNYVTTMDDADSSRCDYFTVATAGSVWNLKGYGYALHPDATYTLQFKMAKTFKDNVNDWKTWLGTHTMALYYALATPTDTQITNSALITQLEALYNTAHSYNGATIVTSSSQYLPAIMDVTVGGSMNEVTYTETELSNPLTITDIEGKSQNTTLNGNIYVDYVYNKKSFSVSIFNLKSADYATIRGFYDRQFTLNEFPLLSIPELNISEMPVFFEIGSREINSQCIVTDKLTLKFRETAQQ